MKRPAFQEVAVVGGPYPQDGTDEAGHVAVGSLGEMAAANSVVRSDVGSN